MLGLNWLFGGKTAAKTTTNTAPAYLNRRWWVYQEFIVKQQECGLLFKDGDFVRFLTAGRYRFFDPRQQYRVEVFDRSRGSMFGHSLLDFFLVQHADVMHEYFTQVETTATQVALIYQRKRLIDVLEPETRVFYWRGFVDTEAEFIELDEQCQVPKTLLKRLLHSGNDTVKARLKRLLYTVEVPQHFIGLLYLNGQQQAVLSAGEHAYWQITQNVQVMLWDTRLQAIEVSGQEILTRDKVSLRINLAASYQLTDVAKALTHLPKPQEFLYQELQFGLRAAVGTRSLDALLEDKTVIEEMVLTHIQAKTNALGIEISSVGVRDIILPGEMKVLLNKVVEAEKAAQATIIRRREETAATRSLLNTAKVMEDNPTALRLKELETLEKVTEKIDKISVYGGLEGLLKELVKLR